MRERHWTYSRRSLLIMARRRRVEASILGMVEALDWGRERERERERNAQRVRGSAHCITLEASESEEEELLMDSVFGEGSLGGIWSG